AQGKVEEAERIALEAIETVGPHDVSSQSSTRVTLASVRMAQRRDDEAEQLLREAWLGIQGTGWRSMEIWIVERLDQFLRDRDRPDPAVDARLGEQAAAHALGRASAMSEQRMRRF